MMQAPPPVCWQDLDDCSKHHARSRSSAAATASNSLSSSRRLSVLSGRSRSNTTASSTTSSTTSSSLHRSPVSSMTSYDLSSSSSPKSSRPSRSSGGSVGSCHERQESVTKSIISRGSRVLHRQGSKFSISSTLDEDDRPRASRSTKSSKLGLLLVWRLFADMTRRRSQNPHLQSLSLPPPDPYQSSPVPIAGQSQAE